MSLATQSVHQRQPGNSDTSAINPCGAGQPSQVARASVMSVTAEDAEPWPAYGNLVSPRLRELLVLHGVWEAEVVFYNSKIRTEHAFRALSRHEKALLQTKIAGVYDSMLMCDSARMNAIRKLLGDAADPGPVASSVAFAMPVDEEGSPVIMNSGHEKVKKDLQVLEPMLDARQFQKVTQHVEAAFGSISSAVQSIVTAHDLINPSPRQNKQLSEMLKGPRKSLRETMVMLLPPLFGEHEATNSGTLQGKVQKVCAMTAASTNLESQIMNGHRRMYTDICSAWQKLAPHTDSLKDMATKAKKWDEQFPVPVRQPEPPGKVPQPNCGTRHEWGVQRRRRENADETDEDSDGASTQFSWRPRR